MRPLDVEKWARGAMGFLSLRARAIFGNGHKLWCAVRAGTIKLVEQKYLSSRIQPSMTVMLGKFGVLPHAFDSGHFSSAIFQPP